MAKHVGMGLIPYKDFFYAHPPIQLLLLAPIAFFSKFFLVEIFMIVISLFSAYFLYLISLEIFKDPDAAFYSFLFFIFSASFVFYSKEALGTYESLLFFLSGFYLLLKKHYNSASLLITLSIFTRYLSIFLLPFLFLPKIKKKEVKKTFGRVAIFSLLVFLSLIGVFGMNYIEDTILYHLKANVYPRFYIPKEYALIGSFEIILASFLFLNDFFVGKRKFVNFLIYIILYHFLLLITLKNNSYHYFIFVSPFLYLFTGLFFQSSQTKFFKSFIILIIFLSLLVNFPSQEKIESYNKIMKECSNIVKTSNETIFGEPYITNYISFVKGNKVMNNFFDTTVRFIRYLGRGKIENLINEKKPEIVFDQWDLNLSKNYERIKFFKVEEGYELVVWKLKSI